MQELFDDLPFDEHLNQPEHEEEDVEEDLSTAQDYAKRSHAKTMANLRRADTRSGTQLRQDKNNKKSKRSRKQKVKRNKKRGRR